jgi:ABC-type lipoprotein export system ATPase subunit
MKITVLPGIDKSGKVEDFDKIDFCPGDTVSIVGHTGSGKSTFINDIEVLAKGDTATKRVILVDDKEPTDDMVRDPSMKPIALITQNTRVITDLPVGKFLELHIIARGANVGLVDDTITLANEFTGEGISKQSKIFSLSGGQTKALLIADAMLISQAPILLLDEVENAGIYKDKFIEYLKKYNKTVLLVTHNPLLSLISDRRIIMENGAVSTIISPNGTEHTMLEKLKEIDMFLIECRERIRRGEIL